MSVDIFNDSNRLHVNHHSSYPSNVCSSALDCIDDDATVITSNVSSNKREQKPFPTPAPNPRVETENAGFAGLRLHTYDAIADSGATQIFVMDKQTSNNTPTKSGIG